MENSYAEQKRDATETRGSIVRCGKMPFRGEGGWGVGGGEGGVACENPMEFSTYVCHMETVGISVIGFSHKTARMLSLCI